MSLTDFQTAVDDLVRDRDQVISTTQRDAAIADAVAVYSASRPREVVVDVASSGGQRVSLPSGFTDDSELLNVEYPVGQVPPVELPLSEVSIYRAPTERQMALPVVTQAGDTIRVTYTAAQLLDASEDTIPWRDGHAVACLAASMLCGQLASYYAGDSEPTISADTVNHQSKSGLWRSRQRALAAVFDDRIGPSPNPREQAASVTRPLPRDRNALGGRRLFHPTRTWPVQ